MDWIDCEVDILSQIRIEKESFNNECAMKKADVTIKFLLCFSVNVNNHLL